MAAKKKSEVSEVEAVSDYKVTKPYIGYSSILVNGVEVKIRPDGTVRAMKAFADNLREKGFIE